MGEFYPVPGFDKDAMRNSTIVVPSVSLANLPQLATDLLVTSLSFKRVGWIGKGDTVVPLVGVGEDGEGIVTGGLEVYGKPRSELFVIQQRSPSIKSRKDAHVALLRDFLTSYGFGFVLVLTSLDAASQDDAQLLFVEQESTHWVLPDKFYSQHSTPTHHPASPPLIIVDPSQSSSDAPSPQSSIVGTIRTSLNIPSVPSVPSSCRPHPAAPLLAQPVGRVGSARGGDGVVVLVVLDMEGTPIREPKSWAGLFGTKDGWSGGLGDDAELYG
ncbi:MAG: hypothetical protein TREMPRED_005178 [Tremellales sp. Tagirdzhanova-0007]|nr:MAG: hypothetical protein TREMPRED_005178 [Tremellales sp. Tagirdzhanova-0007]